MESVKLNKSDQGVGMQFDQEQLNQITQLINSMNQQQQTINVLPIANNDTSSFADFNQQQQNIQFQNQIEINPNFYNNNNNTNPALTNTNQASNFTNFSTSNQGGFKVESNESEMIQEVHTIMVNGQPAIFIPASSAISNNLFCQMMMSSQNHQLNTNQFDNITQVTDQATTSNQVSFQMSFQPVASANTADASEIFWSDGNPMLTTVENQQSNQICVQSDGNITFQPMPFQTQISETTTPTKAKTVASNLGIEQIKNKKMKIQPNTPNKIPRANTVASALSNTSNIAQKKVPKNARSAKISDLGRPNENQLLTIINKTSGVNMSPNENNQASNNNESNMASEENTNTQSSDLVEVSSGGKQKRKACECRNCLNWKQNPTDQSKKRTHCCHKCPKEYNKTSHLRAHLRAHDNYRPYVCDFASCGKSFTRSDELKRHKRIHNDDRNFECFICNKKFLRSDHLNKHILVHNKPIGANANEILAISGSLANPEAAAEANESGDDADQSPFATPEESLNAD